MHGAEVCVSEAETGNGPQRGLKKSATSDVMHVLRLWNPEKLM